MRPCRRRLFWFGALPEGGNAQGGAPPRMNMFQAIGVHGPELSPLGHAVVDVVLVGLAFVFLFSGPRLSPMRIAGLATLVVSITALRVVMQPLPNLQPVTVAALLVGAQLGARRGAAFAVLVALLSNMFIGDGWWTMFQAAGWASVAVLGAKMPIDEEGVLSIKRLCGASVVAAVLFGFVSTMSLIDPSTTVSSFALLLAQGLPFDAIHALGNIAVAIWFGPTMYRFLGGLEDASVEDLATGEGHVVHG